MTTLPADSSTTTPSLFLPQTHFNNNQQQQQQQPLDQSTSSISTTPITSTTTTTTTTTSPLTSTTPITTTTTSTSTTSGSLLTKPIRLPAHLKALESITAFLQSKSCYDILPESFRLIVFDNKLSITRSLQALVTNGVVSAPLYDSTTQRFAGMFTLADVVHLIQYYYLTAHEYENVIAEVEAFQLESLRKIEQAIDVPPPPTISVHPDQPLSDACAALVRTHARRLPLVDRDDQTGKETIVSVLTQYRVLKFIAINCSHDCARLDQSIGSLGIGSYVSWYEPNEGTTTATGTPLASTLSSPHPSPSTQPISLPSTSPPPSSSSSSSSKPPITKTNSSRSRSRSISQKNGGSGKNSDSTPFDISDKYFPLATATLETSVFDVVHIFSERGISAVPIVDEEGVVINMYETVDIVDLVRQNAYHILDKTISTALESRSTDFTGVITCTPLDTLASILSYIRERRCHRFVIVEGEDVEADVERGLKGRKKGSLVGILSLSDVMRYLMGHEDLKGMEVQGLGVHGLRGINKSAGVTSGLGMNHPPSHTISSLSSSLDPSLDPSVEIEHENESIGHEGGGERRGSEGTDSTAGEGDHVLVGDS